LRVLDIATLDLGQRVVVARLAGVGVEVGAAGRGRDAVVVALVSEPLSSSSWRFALANSRSIYAAAAWKTSLFSEHDSQARTPRIFSSVSFTL